MKEMYSGSSTRVNTMYGKTQEWQNSTERGALKVNVDKTEIMVSAKRGREEITEVEDAHHNSLKQVERFKYLGGIITKEGGTEGWIESGWAKWNEVSCVVLDRKMLRRLKLKIYNTVVRPVIMYGSETWALRKREEQQLDRTEMRMLRWMLGISSRERRRNYDIRAEAGVVAISEKIRSYKKKKLEEARRS